VNEGNEINPGVLALTVALGIILIVALLHLASSGSTPDGLPTPTPRAEPSGPSPLATPPVSLPDPAATAHPEAAPSPVAPSVTATAIPLRPTATRPAAMPTALPVLGSR
jgi:hypothetical protein